MVRPDFEKAANLGVTSASIADTLRIATAGDYDQGLAKLNLSQRQVPIVVKLPPGARQDMALLERMTVPGKHGPVMIGNVASLSIDSGPAEIDRYDRQRNINFEIELNQQPLGLVESQAMALPSIQNLPPGVTPDHDRRRRSDERTVRKFWPGDADRGAVHLYRAGDAVQGLRSARDHSGRAGVVGSGCISGAVHHPHRAVDAVDDRAGDVDGHRHQELDPVD